MKCDIIIIIIIIIIVVVVIVEVYIFSLVLCKWNLGTSY